MLELRNNIFENIEDPPKEHYTFQFDSDEVAPVEKKYMGLIKKRMLIFVIAQLVPGIYGVFLDRILIGFAIGGLFIGLVWHIKGILARKKLYAKSIERYKKTVYDYTLYEGFLVIWISSDDSIRQLKVNLNEIKKVHTAGDLLVMEIDNQLFLMKKKELIQNSYFLTVCDKK